MLGEHKFEKSCEKASVTRVVDMKLVEEQQAAWPEKFTECGF